MILVNTEPYYYFQNIFKKPKSNTNSPLSSLPPPSAITVSRQEACDLRIIDLTPRMHLVITYYRLHIHSTSYFQICQVIMLYLIHYLYILNFTG
jgi:hypothetical protein